MMMVPKDGNIFPHTEWFLIVVELFISLFDHYVNNDQHHRVLFIILPAYSSAFRRETKRNLNAPATS